MTPGALRYSLFFIDVPWKRYGFYSLFLLPWVWFFGLGLFYIQINVLHPPADTVSCPYGIVLTGGVGRIRYAFKALTEKEFKQLLVSGVSADPRDVHLLWSQQGVTFGHMARNTVENAKEAALWVKANKITRVCLITHDYHMPRSLLLFRKLVPSLQKIIPICIKSPWEERLRFGFAEYNKLLMTQFFFLVYRCLRISYA